MIDHVLVGVALVIGLGGGYLIARSRLRGHRSDRPDAVHQHPAAVHRHRGLAARARRRPAPGPRRERDPDARLPGPGAEEPAAGVRDPQRGEAGDADAGGDRTARHGPGGCRRRSHRARPLLPSRPGAPLGARDLRPGRRAGERVGARDSPATISSGCCAKAPAEVLILRPGPEDRRVVSAAGSPPGPSAVLRPPPASPPARSG